MAKALSSFKEGAERDAVVARRLKVDAGGLGTLAAKAYKAAKAVRDAQKKAAEQKAAFFQQKVKAE